MKKKKLQKIQICKGNGFQENKQKWFAFFDENSDKGIEVKCVIDPTPQTLLFSAYGTIYDEYFNHPESYFLGFTGWRNLEKHYAIFEYPKKIEARRL